MIRNIKEDTRKRQMEANTTPSQILNEDMNVSPFEMPYVAMQVRVNDTVFEELDGCAAYVCYTCSEIVALDELEQHSQSHAIAPIIALATHPRLGQNSPLVLLDCYLLRVIMNHAK